MIVSPLKLAAVGMMLTVATMLASCNSQPTDTADKNAPVSQGATNQLAAAYRCPMGCEGSASDKPGKCPVCEMDLERNPDYKPVSSTTAADSL